MGFLALKGGEEEEGGRLDTNVKAAPTCLMQ